MPRKPDWNKWAAIVICLAGAVTALVFLARPLAGLLLPFLFAYLLSLAVAPLARRVSIFLRIPEKLCSVVFFSTFLILSILFLGWLLSRLLQEAQDLLIRFWNEEDDLFAPLASLPIPFLREETRASLQSAMRGLTEQALSAIGSRLPDLAMRLTGILPSVLISAVVMIFAGYCFCVDRERILSAILSVLPKEFREKIPARKPAIKSFFKRYLGAYLKIMGLTFLELLLGLLILRVKNALLIALLIALVDILPVLGAGTVLIPWGVIALLRQDFFLGAGLLLLCLFITIVRQVVEPKILGKHFGLHPLLMLAAAYAGFRLFGIPGMLVSPAVALAVKWLFDRRREDRSA